MAWWLWVIGCKVLSCRTRGLLVLGNIWLVFVAQIKETTHGSIDAQLETDLPIKIRYSHEVMALPCTVR